MSRELPPIAKIAMRVLVAIEDRGLRSVTELAELKPHGVRLRYMAGCRCLKCRMANANYETIRSRARKSGDWNGVIDATEARAHIVKLGRVGVGYKIVAEVADLPASIVFGIRSGRRPRCRARTARKILAVTTACRSDAAIISAGRTWQRIGLLLEEGFTKAKLSELLGHNGKALQIHPKRVTVRTAAAVETLYRRYAA